MLTFFRGLGRLRIYLNLWSLSMGRISWSFVDVKTFFDSSRYYTKSKLLRDSQENRADRVLSTYRLQGCHW
jgi:hypothetical protein